MSERPGTGVRHPELCHPLAIRAGVSGKRSAISPSLRPGRPHPRICLAASARSQSLGEGRVEASHLELVVERTLREFLTCGLPQHGFGRLWCRTCRKSFIAPFSCRSRNLCPSCEKKRSLLWAEWLQQEVLAPVPHRHVVLTMPRLLRPTFRKRRELLLDLSQSGAEALAEYVRSQLGADVRPGIVVSIATSGDLLDWHPHGHLLATDGGMVATDPRHGVC